jgi:hypothetical protein
MSRAEDLLRSRHQVLARSQKTPPKPSPFMNRRGQKRKTEEKKSRQSRGRTFAKSDMPHDVQMKLEKLIMLEDAPSLISKSKIVAGGH